MRSLSWLGGALLTLSALCFPVRAQEGTPASANSAAAVVPTGVAATVNGQPIPEVALQRGLKRVPAAKQAEARKEILAYLIDNVLLDQYLLQLRIEVDKEEIDTRMGQLREEIKKEGQTFEKVMEGLMLTEDILRAEMTADSRWEKYCSAQVTDTVLHQLFDKNLEMFDGTMVRARHILLTPPAGNDQAAEGAKQQLAGFKQQLEEQVAQGLAKLPEGTDNLNRERTRCRLLDEAFSALAHKESVCPSKEQGGDLGWFPRAGSMVEPFAKAAFALKPYMLSNVVVTQFGYHLILLTDRRPGKETKFDDVKEVVREVYCDRLRESLCAKLRPEAAISITPAK
jgi:peptidyl-prolyl cis-trans isomerase C